MILRIRPVLSVQYGKNTRLLNNALGPNGFYGTFVVNAHNDQGKTPIVPDVLSAAQSRGVPIISSFLQLLTWLDGRNSSSFGSISWSGNTLSFNVSQAAGARNLAAMSPKQVESVGH